MARNYSNIALDTTLTAGIGAGDLSCVVVSATGWPAAPFAAVIDPGLATEEVIQVTAKAGTTFTITRGFDGTTAQAHALGATVRHSAIAGDFTDLQAADTSEASTRATADTTNAANLTTHAALTTSAHGGIVASTDPRLTDSRTPNAHATSHQSGGSDAIKLDDFATPDDNTDLDATTGRHGLLLKLGGGVTNFLRADGTWNAPPGGGGVSDGDKGDVTVSGSGTVWTVDALPESRITNLVADLAAKLAAASNLSDLANAGTARTNLGLGALATLASITASLISDASANGRSLITATDYAAMKALLSLVIGANVQAWDNDLDLIAAIATTAFGRSYLALADAAAGRALAGSAPRTATYITQTADSELSAEQALGALASGYLKNTTTTGVLSVQATPLPSADLGSGGAGAGAKVLADNQTWITPSGGVSDGDKGDITVSGSGATWTVDPNVVTYAKMQDVSATSRILGRTTAGAGDVEELTGTQALALGIPGLAGSADRISVGGAGTSREFESGDTAPTWSSAPASTDVGTTFGSHLYVNVADNTERLGTYSWAPSGVLDARAKISVVSQIGTSAASFGLHIGDATNASRVLIHLVGQTSTTSPNVQALTYAAAAYTQRGSTIGGRRNEVYVRITRDGSNNWTFYWSDNGLIWQLIATQALTFTVANIGFRMAGVAASTVSEAVSDFLRTSV